MTESSDDIPIVDLSADPASVASVIRDACVRHGFFYLTNHGVPRTVVDGMHDASRAFFALPESAKRTVLASNDANNRGWTPLGEETLDPATQTRGDTKEGYYIGREVGPSSDEHGKPLRGANQWPDETKLGLSSAGGFREPMMRYHAALTNLCDALMPSFAEALGLNPNFFEDKFRFPTATLRPLRYSAHPSRPSEGVLGAGAHSDYGVLTVLWTDGTEGLEIRKDDVWWPVKPLPRHRNAFICNVGDLCERWTNGVFKSTVHRVVTRRDEENADGEESDAVGNRRHSCAFFWEPDFDTRVEPLPACVAENPPRRYEPTTYGEYILAKYRATHADFQRG